ncbi:glycosyltransferase family 4 protein [Nonomuraea sp. MG754425]|uniref:glycosyltransferase family 4 protein n=1 Tax=Nonomuraea sp. MG754425 TaxID=2570319 RepID=UPI001F1DE08C|nr:glycosyltransferase family 4 protein [Nonomuraea sp. MG754425]MCF6473390.1 glycosyltransferase family 4 protein [Nonomuraea sp. MG754425]
MRIVLLQNMFYEPAVGGANRSSRLWMEQLAARGHECLVLARAGDGGAAEEKTISKVRVRFAPGRALPSAAARLVREARPDWVLVPSDDPGQLMLGAALAFAPGRVVYVTHTIQQLPFGPNAFYPSTAGTALLRKVAGVISVSDAAARHLLRHAGIAATVIKPHVYRLPPSDAPAIRREHVLMVNPCDVKGISIFLALADAFPSRRFMAIPTWGTNGDDLAALRRRPHVVIQRPVADLSPILASARVLLMPSLWDETFGYTCVEAMAHGVPVIATEIAGLVEAKLGVPYSLPVRPIKEYRRSAGELVATVPEQPLEPWKHTLSHLLSEPAVYEDVSARSRAAAHAFITSLDPRALEQYLTSLEVA